MNERSAQTDPQLPATDGDRKRPSNLVVGLLAVAWMVGLLTVAALFRAHRSEQEQAEESQPAKTSSVRLPMPSMGLPVMALSQIAITDEPKEVPKEEKEPSQKDGKPEKGKPAWGSLFDGKTLQGWTVADEHFFLNHGKVHVDKGILVLDAGTPATGIRFAKPFPKINYEVSLEAQRMDGRDFFCGMTFPVEDSHCTLIIGGWGGNVIGLSNVDGMNASENITTSGMNFTNKRWYKIRLAVTEEGIGMWIDDDKIIDLDSLDHQFEIWWEMEPTKPFGIATWYTQSGIKNLQVKPLEPAKVKDKKATPAK